MNLGNWNFVKWSSLIFGCVVQLLWGSLGTTPIYINAMKIQYNLTQETVEMLPSIIAVGRCFTPFASFIFQMFGPIGSFLFGLWFGTGGYFLLWSTTFFTPFYHSYPVFMGLYFFFVGHGSMHTYLAVLTVVTKNFEGKHQGKAISLIEACYGATPLVWLLLYRIWFSGEFVYDDAKQDFPGFLVTHAAISAVCTIGGIFLVRPVKSSQLEKTPLLQEVLEISREDGVRKKTNHLLKTDDSTADENKNLANESESGEDITDKSPLWIVLEPFTKWHIQLLLLTFCITNTVSLGVEMNLSVYTKSVRLYHIVDAAIISYNVCLSSFRLGIGVVIDKFKGTVPNMAYVAALSVLTMVTFGVATIVPGKTETVMAISVVTGIFMGVTKAVVAYVVAGKMNLNYFASYWGVFQATQCLILLLWQWILSVLYEAAIPPDGGIECYGDDCMRWILLLASILSGLACVCAILLACIKKF